MKTHYLFGLPFVTIPFNSEITEFLLDTGFNGSILLPKDKIRKHGLRRIALAEYALADGHTAQTEVFEAQVDWLGEQKRIAVVAGESDFTLLGMELLKSAKTVINPIKKELTISKS